MIKKVQSNTENVYVASGYKEIGKSFELNRKRITNIVSSINRSNTEAQKKRIDDLVGTDGITDAEKLPLARELDALKRDFDYLGTDTRNAGLVDSEEYRETKASYDKLVSLMERIVNSTGTYVNSDVNSLTDMYSAYTEKAKALENLILSTTSELDMIASYYAMTKVDIVIYPEAVSEGGSAAISVSVMHDGVERIGDIPGSAISFRLTGLANDVSSEMFGFDVNEFPDARVTVTALTNSAVVENCKSFTLHYDAISESGINVNSSIALDIGLMPF